MIPIIDSHVHLWDTHRLNYPWLDAAPDIRRPFLADEYRRATDGYPVGKIVVVQGECDSRSFLEEVQFIAEQAIEDQRIQAMVAYAPVEDPQRIPGALEALAAMPIVKGIRRMYDDDPGLCCSPAFIEGLKQLAAYGFTFDISVQPHALPATIRMIEQCPGTLFVLDHLGKPAIAQNGWAAFREHMSVLASFPNVVAKISGLVTEARRAAWTPEDLKPYINYAVDKWGFDRLLFGSDWPVVLLAASYSQWIDTLVQILEGCTDEQMAKLFYHNAARTYRL